MSKWVFVFLIPAVGDVQNLGTDLQTLHPIMESKKPGVLEHLRHKMLPHLRRGKTSPSKMLMQLSNSKDHRMSSSVPDIRDVRQVSSHVSSSKQLQTYSSHFFSTPSSTLQPPGLAAGDGSGLQMGPGGRAAGWSEYRLSAPVDCIDWASSQESFSGLCKDEQSSLERNNRIPGDMEPEELALPEKTPAYTPTSTPLELSQDNSQVQLLHLPHYNQWY